MISCWPLRHCRMRNIIIQLTSLFSSRLPNKSEHMQRKLAPMCPLQFPLCLPSALLFTLLCKLNCTLLFKLNSCTNCQSHVPAPFHASLHSLSSGCLPGKACWKHFHPPKQVCCQSCCSLTCESGASSSGVCKGVLGEEKAKQWLIGSRWVQPKTGPVHPSSAAPTAPSTYIRAFHPPPTHLTLKLNPTPPSRLFRGLCPYPA